MSEDLNFMEKKILEEGRVVDDDVLKVDTFLNHQIDVGVIRQTAKAFKEHFGGSGITKVLTVEASGIAIACITAEEFGVPMVFAKKSRSKNLDNDIYRAEVYSYTYDRFYTMMVDRRVLGEDDRVLIVDDFLANGQALKGLLEICSQADADVAGIGICIEKSFQPGGKEIRDMGIDLCSLARIKKMDENGISFEK
jgi:xanthine phosphoribosyltransferase